MVKINSIDITGIRGIKKPSSLDLTAASALIFGENGSGKSSIVDAVEWFYHEKAGKLKGANVDPFMRNLGMAAQDKSIVKISYDDSTKNNTREIEFNKKAELKRKLVNESEDHLKYMQQSIREKMIFRHYQLTEMGLKTGTDRIIDVTNAIGLEELVEFEKVIKGMRSAIDSEIKSKGLEGVIRDHKGKLAEKLPGTVANEGDLVAEVNELLKRNGFSERIQSAADIGNILDTFKESVDTSTMTKITACKNTSASLTAMEKATELKVDMDVYMKASAEAYKSKDQAEKMALYKVLDEAKRAIEAGAVKGNKCPVCEQDKDTTQLAVQLQTRITALESVKKIKDDLTARKTAIVQKAAKYKDAAEKCAAVDVLTKELKEGLSGLSAKFAGIALEFAKEMPQVVEPDGMDVLKKAADYCNKQAKELEDSMAGNKKMIMFSALDGVASSFETMINAQATSAVLEAERKTFDKIASAIKDKKSAALVAFIGEYSTTVQSIYSAINPGENVTRIEIVPKPDNDGDLKGLLVNVEIMATASEPIDYLSESHINGLGLAFFLASAKKNQLNGFIILDDILSSFDDKHRERILKLLATDFAASQIILLTHDKHWYDGVKTGLVQTGWKTYTLDNAGSITKEA